MKRKKSHLKTKKRVQIHLKLHFETGRGLTELAGGGGGEAGRAGKCRIPLLEWMLKRAEAAERAALEAGRARAVNAKGFLSVAKHLDTYINKRGFGREVTLGDVDREFCRGFAGYLTEAENCRGGKLSLNSRFLYFSKFVAALNAAVKAGHIPSNPAALLDKTERPRFKQTERSYLTEEELQTLINTPNTHSSCDVSRAFLFSCFCGLRWSDISDLVWGDIRCRGDCLQIEKRMVKTREMLYLPLSRDAAFFLPPRQDKSPSAPVFHLHSYASASISIRKWLRDAGISKTVTFHSARHTFATLLLSQQQDLYTVSKLLGHKSIKVTQIYAEVVDRKKRDAVNSLSGLFSLPASSHTPAKSPAQTSSSFPPTT